VRTIGGFDWVTGDDGNIHAAGVVRFSKFGMNGCASIEGETDCDCWAKFTGVCLFDESKLGNDDMRKSRNFGDSFMSDELEIMGWK